MNKNQEHKLIAGVLGGMGPLATVDFMSMVIDHCPIVTEEDHVRLLVEQNPHIPNPVSYTHLPLPTILLV